MYENVEINLLEGTLTQRVNDLRSIQTKIQIKYRNYNYKNGSISYK